MLRRSVLAIGVAAALLGATTAGAANEWVTCDPVNVASFGSRVHVKCAASIGGVQWFARSTSDPADAARFLNVLLAAHVAGRPLDVLTDLSDTSGNPPGCLVSDCRLMQAAAVLE